MSYCSPYPMPYFEVLWKHLCLPDDIFLYYMGSAFCLTGSRACLIIRKPKCAIKPNLWTQGLHSNGWLMYWPCFIHIVGKHTNEWRCKVKLIMKMDFSISWNPTKSDEKCKAQSCCKKPSIMLILRSIRACKYLSFGLVVIWKCILFF